MIVMTIIMTIIIIIIVIVVIIRISLKSKDDLDQVDVVEGFLANLPEKENSIVNFFFINLIWIIISSWEDKIMIIIIIST